MHGDEVWAGARLEGVNSGYGPTRVPDRKGTLEIPVSVIDAGDCTAITLFLYEQYRFEPFAERTYAFEARFE